MADSRSSSDTHKTTNALMQDIVPGVVDPVLPPGWARGATEGSHVTTAQRFLLFNVACYFALKPEP